MRMWSSLCSSHCPCPNSSIPSSPRPNFGPDEVLRGPLKLHRVASAAKMGNMSVPPSALSPQSFKAHKSPQSPQQVFASEGQSGIDSGRSFGCHDP